MSRYTPPPYLRGDAAVAGLRHRLQRKVEDEGPPQLTIGGGEVTSEEANRKSTAGRLPSLTQSQRLILRHIEEHGAIRSVEAGVIVHRCRLPRRCGFGARAVTEKALGCCAYAPADGLTAMKRLEKRGLVRKVRDGRWERQPTP